jgi:hypothetical protein
VSRQTRPRFGRLLNTMNINNLTKMLVDSLPPESLEPICAAFEKYLKATESSTPPPPPKEIPCQDCL